MLQFLSRQVKQMRTSRPARLLVLLLFVLALAGCAAPTAPATTNTAVPSPSTNAPAHTPSPAPVPPTLASLARDGHFNTRDEVALYIHLYGELPDNYITKAEARKLGWTSGSVEKVAPGRAIGGDRFGNYEGLLPTQKGRQYIECDIDTWGQSSRGAKRIVFSTDGLIFYTDDHYVSFEQLF